MTSAGGYRAGVSLLLETGKERESMTMVREKSINVFLAAVERQRLLAGHAHHHKRLQAVLAEEDGRVGLGILLLLATMALSTSVVMKTAL